jgi:hypothetical protein
MLRFLIIVLVAVLVLRFLYRLFALFSDARPDRHRSRDEMGQPKQHLEYHDVKDAKFEEIPKKSE